MSMDKRKYDNLRLKKITLVRNGKETVTCMNDLVSEPINKDLISCIIANDLLKDYEVVFRRKEGDILCRVWKRYVKGKLTQQECTDLFGILLDPVWNPGEEIFQKACEEWDPSDTFIFDLLPPDMFHDDEAGRALNVVYPRSKFDPHKVHSLQRYLNLCCFLVVRGYAVDAGLVCRILLDHDKSPEVVKLFQRWLAKFPGSFRGKIYGVLLVNFVDPFCWRWEGHRPIDSYHLLADRSVPVDLSKDSVPVDTDRRWREAIGGEPNYRLGLKGILASAYQKKICEHFRFDEDTEKILESILNPETCTSFPGLFQAASPWWKESIQTIMILHQVPGNLVHLLPKELIFLILHGLL